MLDGVDLEDFLADQLTFDTVHTWGDEEALYETADQYFDGTNLPAGGWTKRSFRDHFRRASLDEQLAIHEILNLENPATPRVTNEEIDTLYKHFNKANVSRERFGKVILALPKTKLRELMYRTTKIEASRRKERKRKKKERKQQRWSGHALQVVDKKRSSRKERRVSQRMIKQEASHLAGWHDAGIRGASKTAKSSQSSETASTLSSGAFIGLPQGDSETPGLSHIDTRWNAGSNLSSEGRLEQRPDKSGLQNEGELPAELQFRRDLLEKTPSTDNSFKGPPTARDVSHKSQSGMTSSLPTPEYSSADVETETREKKHVFDRDTKRRRTTNSVQIGQESNEDMSDHTRPGKGEDKMASIASRDVHHKKTHVRGALPTISQTLEEESKALIATNEVLFAGSIESTDSPAEPANSNEEKVPVSQEGPPVALKPAPVAPALRPVVVIEVTKSATQDFPIPPSAAKPGVESIAQTTRSTNITIAPSTPRKKPETKSRFFETTISSKKRKRTSEGTPSPSTRKTLKLSREAVSCIPFPPLNATNFGLVQELLAHDPFQLLIAVNFLNRTKGTAALPVFWNLMDAYPTPTDLANATVDTISSRIKHLGLQNQRTQNIINIARQWLDQSPAKGRRYRTLHYPQHDDGKDIKPGAVLDDDDPRVGAWEIAHLPGCGDYAIDSWRIFCRDRLRGVAGGYKGEDAPEGFEPEWKRVVPKDKELRAFLRWMWLKEGWEWDPVTGEKSRADKQLMELGRAGNVEWEERKEFPGVSKAQVDGLQVEGKEQQTGQSEDHKQHSPTPPQRRRTRSSLLSTHEPGQQDGHLPTPLQRRETRSSQPSPKQPSPKASHKKRSSPPPANGDAVKSDVQPSHSTMAPTMDRRVTRSVSSRPANPDISTPTPTSPPPQSQPQMQPQPEPQPQTQTQTQPPTAPTTTSTPTRLDRPARPRHRLHLTTTSMSTSTSPFVSMSKSATGRTMRSQSTPRKSSRVLPKKGLAVTGPGGTPGSGRRGRVF